MTEKLLKTITEAEMFRSIEKLNLANAVDFTLDSSVNYFGKLLAEAKKLYQVNIASGWENRDLHITGFEEEKYSEYSYDYNKFVT